MKTPLERFTEWMRTRDGGKWAHLGLKRYMDGEPYFKTAMGAEFPLREFIKREKELTAA